MKARDFKSLASTNFATWADDFLTHFKPYLHWLIGIVLRTIVYHNATWADDFLTNFKPSALLIPIVLRTIVYHNTTWALFSHATKKHNMEAGPGVEPR